MKRFLLFQVFCLVFLRREDTTVVSSKCHQATRWKACSTKENKIDKRYSSEYDQAYGVIFLLHTYIRKTRFVFKNLTYAYTHKRNFRIIFALPGKCLQQFPHNAKRFNVHWTQTKRLSSYSTVELIALNSRTSTVKCCQKGNQYRLE